MMKKTIRLGCLYGWVSCCTALAQLAPMHHLTSAPMPKLTRELFDESMGLLDASYDAQAHLVLHPNDRPVRAGGRYMVRESSWYALGLLIRDRAGDRPGDLGRAIDILQTVLAQQYLDPTAKWYGTYKRSPEEPGPVQQDAAFTAYDPNWRQFIGTTLEIILIEYADRLPAELSARMYRSIDAAVSGEIHDGRLVPSYSNIALMYGALWDFAARHDRNADWVKRSAEWTEAVYSLFHRYGTFNEYNAPTYYGVDLYGLALWREYGSTQQMRQAGRTMEAGLWNDLADFYQPQLRNIAGPYDRAYGMDMSSYVTPTGVWMRSVLDGAHAPLPEQPTLTTFQVADMWFGPQVALLGTRVPQAALEKLRHFAGAHLVDRRIDAQRVATSWVGSRAIWGAEFTSMKKDTGKSQFHPVTAQWRMPSGVIGWIQLTRSPNIDAVADRTGVTITTDGDVSFRIFSSGSKATITEASWALAGFSAGIRADAKGFSLTRPADCSECEDVTYTGVHTMRMELRPEGAAN
jgi:hypothetical protein